VLFFLEKLLALALFLIIAGATLSAIYWGILFPLLIQPLTKPKQSP